ncbi:Cyclic di-GMP phosphodiesterase response regulator RpfG [Maioricimonas rarisocia]|uniref:Cyclic di-GMP phosphodiesterase response regulator RpfG n=1 Tax=Maioricimonas rarisocia TaxID=2528026 RepID=A0A517ZCF0_9PLAN|nr:HD-GYP domain-containing protein [Maioricimonas rarisocia]QDU40132.1 Cyclic di-GMP phosphodiesterase response regulator RpfG [Maioricimonas rarisocia]
MTVQIHRTANDPAFAAARLILDEAFNTSFCFGRDSESCLTELNGNRATLVTSDGNSIDALLARVASDREPLVEPLLDGRSLLVIPVVDTDGRDALAWGISTDSGRDLLLRLARSTSVSISQQAQIRQYEEQLEDYVCQVSRDFEELVWLRSLAEQIGCTQEDHETDRIAATVFPELRTMVQAEAIILVNFLDGEDRSTVTDKLGQCRITRIGETAVCDETVHRLIRDLGTKALHEPVVMNDFRDRETLSKHAALDSCVLVPIANQRHQYGWLLAVNRTIAETAGQMSLELAAYSSAEQEFGTFEAGLLESSAVFLASHARNSDLFRQQELLLIGTVRAMINAVDARDPYTCGHSDRVALIARRLAAELGESPRRCEEIYLSGLLHDIGKIGVPDHVLLKPGRLTAEEFALIRKHPEIGYKVLRHLKPLEYVLPGVLHHHEAVDGSGYPFGLKGDEIPFDARVIAVADSLDAMTSSRPYREGMPFDKAESILRECAGQQWDSAIVDAYFAARDDIVDICCNADSHTQQILLGRDSVVHTVDSDSIIKAFAATRERQL